MGIKLMEIIRPLRYLGGKRKLLPYVLPRLRRLSNLSENYTDVFVGGGVREKTCRSRSGIKTAISIQRTCYVPCVVNMRKKGKTSLISCFLFPEMLRKIRKKIAP